jgi:hypothetical protein
MMLAAERERECRRIAVKTETLNQVPSGKGN